MKTFRLRCFVAAGSLSLSLLVAGCQASSSLDCQNDPACISDADGGAPVTADGSTQAADGGAAVNTAAGQPCNVGDESGVTCSSVADCSSGEMVQGCCISGTCKASSNGPCTPGCAGRVCGMDPVCGTLDCGSCKQGERCVAGSKCEAVQGTKLLPPPGGGMYLGQSEFPDGARATLETAIGVPVALWGVGVVGGMENSDNHALNFDTSAAQQAWDQGYVVLVGAYEAYPGHGSFTVDKLLRGDYDADLQRLATQFRQFNKPMIFSTAREPNGVLGPYMGGFGPNGDQRRGEAGDMLGQFDPPAGPAGKPDLYAGMGDPKVCDGLERLAAAQRYYHDFFVRREGIDFLTFETMGWAIPTGNDVSTGPCSAWTTFYKLIEGYSDWVSLNFYMVTEEPQEQTMTSHLDRFDTFMREVRRVAPGVPVLITELGFCDRSIPEKISNGLAHLAEQPDIAGILLWGTTEESDGVLTNCQVTAGAKGDAFKAVMAAQPDRFHSCAIFSDGSSPASCR